MKILEMLTYTRPAGSASEAEFIGRFITPHRPSLMAGNLVVTVPGDPDTLFSCHTDTVHKASGKQQVIYDEPLDMAFKQDKLPLGGDDTAGVWLLLEMIALGIPGTYVFHYGEEIGCVGSKALAREHPEFLETFKRAIAFDRRGTTSVITHQMGDRCCSDEFGIALATALGGGYVLDDTGLYTDTASYMELIPECTNVSVGYDHEHGPEEFLDVAHLNWLREAVQHVRWHELPVKRDPAARPEWNPYSDDEAWWQAQDRDYILDEAFTDIQCLADAEDMVRYEPLRAAEILWAFISEQVQPAVERLLKEEMLEAN